MIRWRANEIMIGREVAALDALPPVPLARGGSVWDRRFFVEIRGAKKQNGSFCRALGGEGLGRLERAGLQVPKTVPRCYLHVLPAVFDADGLVSCPVLAEQKRFSMVPWQPDTPYLPEIKGEAGW